MHRQALYALGTPVYDPDKEINTRHFWEPQRWITAGLTVNIGME